MNRLCVVAIGLTLSGGCGQAGPASLRAAPTSRPAAVATPRIDWAHPLARGIPSSRAQARAQGRLSFDPVVPAWAVAEESVDVTDPATGDPAHASVALAYHFPTSADFPTDGRVVVVEAPTDQTESDFAKIVESNGADHFHVVTVSGRPALLIEADGIGRVRIIRGGVVIDITGPATPPETVLRLAAAFG